MDNLYTLGSIILGISNAFTIVCAYLVSQKLKHFETILYSQKQEIKMLEREYLALYKEVKLSQRSSSV